MKTTKIKITATRFENGHILIASNPNNDEYYVMVGNNWVACYSRNEMKEIYHVDPIDL